MKIALYIAVLIMTIAAPGALRAQPVMQRFNIPATARASFALYNTREEVDALVAGIEKVREVFA